MARRDLEEINAGSMADIAFLLLIFFLVTTTMEVDAGIGRQLPLKVEKLDDQISVPVIERNVLEILANSKDQLLVEGKYIEIDELYDIVYAFYTSNRDREDQNINMPNYVTVNVSICQSEIADLQKSLEKNPDSPLLNSELSKWKTKLDLCRSLPGQSYREMNKVAIIQLKNQAGTSYGLYIQIHNELKKVVNELRVEKCEQYSYGNYFELKESDPADQETIKKLRVLVPERIIEKEM